MSDLLARVRDDIIPITPSDTTPQAKSEAFAGLIVLAAGNVAFRTPRGIKNNVTITITAAAAGLEINVAVSQVMATGTTATVGGFSGQPYRGLP